MFVPCQRTPKAAKKIVQFFKNSICVQIKKNYQKYTINLQIMSCYKMLLYAFFTCDEHNRYWKRKILIFKRFVV